MTTLDKYLQSAALKTIFMGDSGTGKTGALASLVAAGYKLRIYDFDDGVGYLAARIKADHPELLSSVAVTSLKSDKWKITGVVNGNAMYAYEGVPKDFSNFISELENWTDPPLGNPYSWSPEDTIVVVDSLTFMCKAAYRYCDMLNPGAKDKRNTFYNAQNCAASVLSKLTSASFKPNVIVVCHIDWQATDDPSGMKKGYPRSIGTAMNPEIPAYFNNALLAETMPGGNGQTHVIKTAPTGMIDLKASVILPNFNPLPLATGLREFFKLAKGKEPI